MTAERATAGALWAMTKATTVSGPASQWTGRVPAGPPAGKVGLVK